MTPPSAEPEKFPVTNKQIKHMVERFLGWRLPENFNPDAGISFKREFNEHTAYPMKHEPTGTNLFDATQAEEMVRYMVEGLPDAAHSTSPAPHRYISTACQHFKHDQCRLACKFCNTKCECDCGHRFVAAPAPQPSECVCEHPNSIYCPVHHAEPNDERAEFEKWAISLFLVGESGLVRRKDGRYAYDQARALYSLWQARASLERTRSVDWKAEAERLRSALTEAVEMKRLRLTKKRLGRLNEALR